MLNCGIKFIFYTCVFAAPCGICRYESRRATSTVECHGGRVAGSRSVISGSKSTFKYFAFSGAYLYIETYVLT